MISSFFEFVSEVVIPSLSVGFYFAAPFVLPLLFGSLFLYVWLEYIRALFINKQEYMLLEIKLPKEQPKSPLAMELVLNALHQSGPMASTWFDVYWKGGVRPWFSLEIISIEGDVRFFIWMRRSFRSFFESQIYAQYPEVEVTEAEDYTRFIEFDKDKIDIWGCEFGLVKDDAYPIKTYVDYGLDKNPKEEEKIDPMTPMIEFLGSIGTGQQIWYQILVQMHRGREEKNLMPWQKWFGKGKTTWQKDAEKEMNKILKRDPKTKTSSEKIDDKPTLTITSKIEKDTAEAIERSITKPGFDIGIRGLYITDADKFTGMNIGGMLSSWKQYGSNNLNAIRPVGGMTIFSYPWQDFRNIRKNKVKTALFDAYRRRSFFHAPYKGEPFVFNTEELATIYHFPGSVAKTPSFKRIDAKKTQAPFNLPT